MTPPTASLRDRLLAGAQAIESRQLHWLPTLETIKLFREAADALAGQQQGEAALWRAKVEADTWMYFTYEPKHLQQYEPLYPAPPATVDTQALLALAEKLAAHVRPTCSELWEEAQAILATPQESAQSVDEVDEAAYIEAPPVPAWLDDSSRAWAGGWRESYKAHRRALTAAYNYCSNLNKSNETKE